MRPRGVVHLRDFSPHGRSGRRRTQGPPRCVAQWALLGVCVGVGMGDDRRDARGLELSLSMAVLPLFFNANPSFFRVRACSQGLLCVRGKGQRRERRRHPGEAVQDPEQGLPGVRGKPQLPFFFFPPSSCFCLCNTLSLSWGTSSCLFSPFVCALRI